MKNIEFPRTYWKDLFVIDWNYSTEHFIIMHFIKISIFITKRILLKQEILFQQAITNFGSYNFFTIRQQNSKYFQNNKHTLMTWTYINSNIYCTQVKSIKFKTLFNSLTFQVTGFTNGFKVQLVEHMRIPQKKHLHLEHLHLSFGTGLVKL